MRPIGCFEVGGTGLITRVISVDYRSGRELAKLSQNIYENRDKLDLIEKKEEFDPWPGPDHGSADQADQVI